MTTLLPLHLSMSNACLLSGEKHVLVDTGFAGDLPKIEKLLQKQGIGLHEISLIVLTHVHFDHVGNAAAIQKKVGCPIAVHRLEKTLMEKGENAPLVPVHPLAKLVNPLMNQPFHPAAVDVTLDDGFDLNPYGVAAKVIFTPGHTPGSVSVITDSGDAVVADLIGGGVALGQFRPEIPRYHYWYSSVDDVNASLKRVFAHQPKRIYVGHGGPLDGERARVFFKMD